MRTGIGIKSAKLARTITAGICAAALSLGSFGINNLTTIAKEDETIFFTKENEGNKGKTYEEDDGEGNKKTIEYNENNILNNGNGDRKKATPIKVNTEITGALSAHYETNGNQINLVDTQGDVDYYYFKITEPGTVSLTVSHDGVFQGTYLPVYGPWFASLYGGTDGSVLYTTVDIPGGLEQSNDAVDGHLKSKTSFNYNVTEGEYYIEFRPGDYVSLAEPNYYFKVNYTPSKGKKMEQESNETAVTATEIPINTEYWGQLSLSGDIDWYKFTIDKPGVVSVKIEHEGVEYDAVNGANYYPWYVSLFGDTESSIVYFTYNRIPAGDAYKPDLSELVSYNLTDGTYYLKINTADYHVGNSYYLTVNYENYAEYEKRTGKRVEQENNNSVSYSNEIIVSKDKNEDFNGQLSTSRDEDWYSFTLAQPAYVKFNFKHKEWDDVAKIWSLSMYNDKLLSKTLLMDSFSANNPDYTTENEVLVPDGTYYFQINGSSWVPDTYTIKVVPDWKDLDCAWLDYDGKSYWYEENVRQGTYSDKKGVVGDNGPDDIRGREICDNSVKDAFGNGTWFWLDSVYDGAKAEGKEVWMPYIYQDEATWDDARIESTAAESDYGMEGMGRCVRDAIKNKSGKWVRYDNEGKMLKGWVTIEGELSLIYPKQAGNTYYYDSRTGLMAKGDVVIDGVKYHFDETTGVLSE